MSDTPDLSVIVTIVDSGETLRACLDALTVQTGGHRLEVLVPYDHLSADARKMARDFPDFDFVDIGAPLDAMTPRNPLETHAFYDIRRTEALKLAKGNLIGIIEDRGVPAPDWAERMIALHVEHPDGVIGGAVVNGVDRLRNWAIFFCDFGRYQPPLNDKDPEYVTDTNIVYKREAILAVRHLWDEKYQEAQIHWAMRRDGVRLRLSDAPITTQKRALGRTGPILSERFHWARMFGQVRGRETGLGRLAVLILASPVLPLMLFVRHFRRQIAKGHSVSRFVAASPFTLLLLICWSAGEAFGYLEAAFAKGRA